MTDETTTFSGVSVDGEAGTSLIAVAYWLNRNP